MSSSAFALFVAIAAGHAIAQSAASYLFQFPDCAQQPLVQGVAKSDCMVTDLDCICGNQNLLQDLASAISADCNTVDQLTASDVASKLCRSISSSGSSTPMTTAVVSAPGLTTTFMMSMQPTSVPVTISVQKSTSTVTEDDSSATQVGSSSTTGVDAPISVTRSTSTNATAAVYILTDTSLLLTGTATSKTTTLVNYTSTITHSTTTSSPTGGAPSSEMIRFGWVAIGMGAMGLVFAEL